MVWVSPQTRESVVVNMRVRVPFTVMPSPMKMGICAMFGVWVGVTAVVVIVGVIPPATVCFHGKWRGDSN